MQRREFITLLGSAAAVWPLAARAQQLTTPTIGYMSARSPEDTVQVLAAFHKGLGEGGFVSGRDVSVEYRWARGDYSRLPALAAELVQRRVNRAGRDRRRCFGSRGEGSDGDNSGCLQHR